MQQQQKMQQQQQMQLQQQMQQHEQMQQQQQHLFMVQNACFPAPHMEANELRNFCYEIL